MIGLGRVLGVKVSKDLFSESITKSRELFTQLKEKLSQQVYKRIALENQDIFPTPFIERQSPNKSPVKKKLDDLETENVEVAQTKTPKEVNARATVKGKETSPFQQDK